mgnify:CR=1 FL=1
MYDVCYIRFKDDGKEYCYLIDPSENIKVGDEVFTNEDLNAHIVIRVDKIKELPVPLNKMKHLSKHPNDDLVIGEIINLSGALSLVSSDIELVGRNDIIESLYVSLMKKRMHNTVLIGEAGSGKSSIVYGLSRVVSDSFYILELNMGELISGTTLRGMLEERISNIFSTIIEFNKGAKKKIIIFIDEIHMIMYSCNDGDYGVYNLLKVYLTSPYMYLIGATTINEYKKSIKTDLALRRRITPLFVCELDSNAVIKILKDFSDGDVSDDMLKYIYERSLELIGMNNPDSSLEILDRLLARRMVLKRDIDYDNINYVVEEIKKAINI